LSDCSGVVDWLLAIPRLVSILAADKRERRQSWSTRSSSHEPHWRNFWPKNMLACLRWNRRDKPATLLSSHPRRGASFVIAEAMTEMTKTDWW